MKYTVACCEEIKTLKPQRVMTENMKKTVENVHKYFDAR